MANTDWLSLGRTWSAAEIPLEVKTGVGHDVGFLSFPFAEELELYVIYSFLIVYCSFPSTLHLVFECHGDYIMDKGHERDGGTLLNILYSL